MIKFIDPKGLFRYNAFVQNKTAVIQTAVSVQKKTVTKAATVFSYFISLSSTASNALSCSDVRLDGPFILPPAFLIFFET